MSTGDFMIGTASFWACLIQAERWVLDISFGVASGLPSSNLCRYASEVVRCAASRLDLFIHTCFYYLPTNNLPLAQFTGTCIHLHVCMTMTDITSEVWWICMSFSCIWSVWLNVCSLESLDENSRNKNSVVEQTVFRLQRQFRTKNQIITIAIRNLHTICDY
jgi:hypothetical protein